MKNYGASFLFFAQTVAHLGLIYGVLNFHAWEWLIVLGIYFLTGCLGVSITYHRLLSHQSFRSPRWFEILGTLCATYGLVGSSLAWVNNHRSHHLHTDTARDPHSPQHHGWANIQWFSMFTSETKFRYVVKILRDHFHVVLHRNYIYIHLGIFLSLFTLGGIHAVCLYYLVPAAVLWNLGSLINTLCHSRFGYRNYELQDDLSKNNFILGFLVWGEGWHNNHHKHPVRAQYGEKWWEFDISYKIIRLIQKK